VNALPDRTVHGMPLVFPDLRSILDVLAAALHGKHP